MPEAVETSWKGHWAHRLGWSCKEASSPISLVRISWGNKTHETLLVWNGYSRNLWYSPSFPSPVMSWIPHRPCLGIYRNFCIATFSHERTNTVMWPPGPKLMLCETLSVCSFTKQPVSLPLVPWVQLFWAAAEWTHQLNINPLHLVSHRLSKQLVGAPYSLTDPQILHVSMVKGGC